MQEGNLLREMGAATRNRGPDGAEQAFGFQASPLWTQLPSLPALQEWDQVR